MMKIFSANERNFETNGLCQIMPISCIEEKRKSLNGWSIECEVSLEFIDIIQKDNIVVVETKEKGQQPFIINAPTIEKTIKFSADHFFFSTKNYVLYDVRPTNLIGYDFLKWVNDRTDTISPFNVYSNVSIRKTKYFIRKTYLDALEEIEELFGASFDIDNFDIKLLTSTSNISDVKLIYGKNIEGIKKYENWDNVCTKVLAIGPEELLLPEKYISSKFQYDQPYTKIVQFEVSNEKEDGTIKTEAEKIVELRELATKFIEVNQYPKLNYTVNANVPQNLCVGDIVPVLHPIATINTEVQAYKYNVLTKKIISIEYGNYERNVKKAMSSIKDEIKNVDKKTDNFLLQAKEEVNYLMNVAGKNGTVVFRKNDEGVIYEILAMDTSNIETAKTIMRLNSQGLAGTTGGINGVFNSAVMANGTVLADAIKAGTLKAIDIEGVKISGGTITSTEMKNGLNFHVDKDGNLIAKNGEFSGKINANSGSIGGWNIYSNGLTNGILKIEKNGVTNIYTWADLYIIRLIITQALVADEDMISHYDFNGDGKISSIDYVLFKNMLKAL